MNEEPEQQECRSTTHYAGCACHEKGWENKWKCAVETAAQAQLLNVAFHMRIRELERAIRFTARQANSDDTDTIKEAIERAAKLLPENRPEKT